MGVGNDWYLSSIADSTELHTVLNHHEGAMRQLRLKFVQFVVAEHSSWSFMMGSDSQQYLLWMYQLVNRLMGQYMHGKNGHVLYSGNWNLPGNQSVFGVYTISRPTYLSLKNLQKTISEKGWGGKCIFCETCPLCHGNKLPHPTNAHTHPYATHCEVVWV